MKNKNIRLTLSHSFTLLLISIIFINISCSQKTPPSEKKATVKKIDPQILAGRWIRPDGGYVLEVSNIKENGSIAVAYFNPKPINVAESYWQWDNNRLNLFVKFDDVNYTGSTYTLEYLPDKKRLIGIYFQAMLGQKYYVEFTKME